MVWVSVEFTAYLSKILDNGPPAHPDAYHFRNLEPFPGTDSFGKASIGAFQEFVVIAAQSSFPAEGWKHRYLLIPIRKENVNQVRVSVWVDRFWRGTS